MQGRRLGDIVTIRPDKRELRAGVAENTPVSFVPMECLNSGRHDLSEHTTRPLNEVYGSYTYFREGDVLLAKITPCFENGKLGIARNLTNGIGFGSSEFFVIRPSEEVTADYLYYYFERQCFRDAGKQVMTGAVGHKRVPREFLESLDVPVPSIDEQRRIVAVLDEAFEGLARARANAEANLRNTRELFDGFVASTFANGGQGWPTKTLDDIAENLDRHRVPIRKSERLPGDVPYYGASGVVDYVADFIFDDDLLLVSEDGANLLTRTYPIAFSISGKTWVNNHAHVLKFDDIDTQEFVRIFLNSISLEPYVSGMAQPKLNQAALNRIPIPFPDHKTRCDVVAKAAELSFATDELADAYKRSLKDIDALKQSLLHKAFSGGLT